MPPEFDATVTAMTALLLPLAPAVIAAHPLSLDVVHPQPVSVVRPMLSVPPL